MSTGIFSVVLQITGKTLKKIMAFPVLRWCFVLQDKKSGLVYIVFLVLERYSHFGKMLCSLYLVIIHICAFECIA